MMHWWNGYGKSAVDLRKWRLRRGGFSPGILFCFEHVYEKSNFRLGGIALIARAVPPFLLIHKLKRPDTDKEKQKFL